MWHREEVAVKERKKEMVSLAQSVVGAPPQGGWREVKSSFSTKHHSSTLFFSLCSASPLATRNLRSTSKMCARLAAEGLTEGFLNAS